MANTRPQPILPSVEQLNACFDLLALGRTSLSDLARASSVSTSALKPIICELIEQDVLLGEAGTEGSVEFSPSVERLNKPIITKQIRTRHRAILEFF